MAFSLTISSCTFISSLLKLCSARPVTGASSCFGRLVLKQHHTAWLKGVKKAQSVSGGPEGPAGCAGFALHSLALLPYKSCEAS